MRHFKGNCRFSGVPVTCPWKQTALPRRGRKEPECAAYPEGLEWVVGFANGDFFSSEITVPSHCFSLNSQWVPVLQDFSSKGTLWGFVPLVQEQRPTDIPLPIALHTGDYNMDGYPDAVVILRNTSGRYGD